MTRFRLAPAAFAVLLAVAPWAASQAPVRVKLPVPKPEPVADVKLLMNGFARPNFRGLGNHLKDVPKDAGAWEFARGQALLIAETANLLLLRPPAGAKDAADVWLSKAVDLRDAAVKLGRASAAKDYPAARAAHVDLANACNRCHVSSKVGVRVAPFPDDE